MLLGAVGGIVGLIVAPLATRALVRSVVVGDVSQFPFSTGIDLRVLLFNFLIAFAASILFSLAPALRFLKPDLVTSLKQQSGTSGASPLRFRRITVGLQIGLSLLLVVGAGLFVRTLHNLESQDVGFVTSHLVTFGVNPQLAGYQSGPGESPAPESSSIRSRRSPECVQSGAPTIPNWQATTSAATSPLPATTPKTTKT